MKSLLGELLTSARAGSRGLEGDRLWAVRDADGKFGSGKNTRRFRRMEGLFSMRASGSPPTVALPDGRHFAAADPEGHAAIGALLGRAVTLAPEADVPHHDEGPVSVMTTAALRTLASLDGAPVDPQRFRANLLLDTAGDAYPEDAWPGRALHVGPDVVLRVVRPLTRCVMVDQAQATAPEHGGLLKLLAAHHGMTFGVVATVERPGIITMGDTCEIR